MKRASKKARIQRASMKVPRRRRRNTPSSSRVIRASSAGVALAAAGIPTSGNARLRASGRVMSVVSLRLSKGQLDRIDKFIARRMAKKADYYWRRPTRSQIIVEALEAFLPKAGDS